MTYLITGVTGGLGRGVLDYLSQKVSKNKISVLVRTEEKGEPFRKLGYDVRIGDYAQKDKLTEAFKGIDTLFFVSGVPGQSVPRLEQHQNVVEAASNAGVTTIVYTSISNGDKSTAVLAPDHIATEKLIKASGLRYKILRNNWYFENELGTLNAALGGQGFVYAAGDGKVGWALRREYAEAAANVLASDQSTSEIYELAGKERTYAELAQALKNISDQSFEVQWLSDKDYREGLRKAGLPDEAIAIVAGIQQDIFNHQLEVEHSDLEALLGHSQTSLEDSLKEILN